MLRNQEIKLLVVIMMITTFIGIGISFFLHPLAGVVVILNSLVLIICNLIFTRRRYHSIEELSGYLRRIYAGEYTLDIRDNQEGELSILKNEIYKVTTILSKSEEHQRKEKEHLADILSDISHQLKTPLTSMIVMTDLLRSPGLEREKQKQFTKQMGVQLERMQWLLTSMLKLSKIDAKTVRFKKETISVNQLIRHALEPLYIPMELKDQKLEINVAQEITFLGDFNWSAEAILNIVKNCMEHTKQGGTIRISCDENPLYTQIIIEDNGSGIEKEDLPYIFQRFYKGKNAGEDSVGIGLAMALSIMKNQNGDISVTSKKEEGTSFYLKIYKSSEGQQL